MDKTEFIEKARGFMEMAIADPDLFGDMSQMHKSKIIFPAVPVKKSPGIASSAKRGSRTKAKVSAPEVVASDNVKPKIVAFAALDCDGHFRGALEFFLAPIDPHVPEIILRNLERKSQITNYTHEQYTHGTSTTYMTHTVRYIPFDAMWDLMQPYFEQRMEQDRFNQDLLQRMKRLERALKVEPEEPTY